MSKSFGILLLLVAVTAAATVNAAVDHRAPGVLDALAGQPMAAGELELMKIEGCQAPGKTLKEAAAKGCAYATRSLERFTELGKKKEKVKHFGGEFKTLGFVDFVDLLNKPKPYDGKVVKVVATVDSVCKKKGCWLVLADKKKPGWSVRVRMKDYGFFVPLDCDGKQAIVEGSFGLKVVKEATAKHYAEDAGKDSSKIKGDKLELSMMAVAIDIVE